MQAYARGANFIILDEPTNHLDINSGDLESAAINSYEDARRPMHRYHRTATRIRPDASVNQLELHRYCDYYLKKMSEGLYFSGMKHPVVIMLRNQFLL